MFVDSTIQSPGDGRTPPTPPAADDPCAHCGLPVGRRPAGNDPYFCCTACETVFGVLTDSGLAGTYYRLRNIAPTGADAPLNSVATSYQTLVFRGGRV